jgi:phosphonate transport system permease protein
MTVVEVPAPHRTRLASEAIRAYERARWMRSGAGLATFVACVVLAAWVGQFEPARLVEGLPKLGDFFARLVPPVSAASFLHDMGEWYWGLGKWFGLLVTTLLMALLATTLGTLGGGVLSFFASRNLSRSAAAYWLARRALEVARAVPDLVWALIFVFAFGLGPLAGVLAIALHSLGAQGKLFAEVNENIDMKPLEGVRASGGRWSDEIVYGVIPQVLPNFVSYTFWRFEINVRLATIIGFVGAGGIGMELYDAIALNYFADVGAILIIVAMTVFAIDAVSEHLRLRLAGLLERSGPSPVAAA